MKIETAMNRNDDFVEHLLNIWEASVRETHDFLTDSDVRNLRPQVRQALEGVAMLSYAIDDDGCMCGFMGVEGNKIEMLFIHPARRGTGIGKKFISYANEMFEASLVDVNEWNTQGVGFYAHLGFKVIGRSPFDGNGNPFPILHMSK